MARHRRRIQNPLAITAVTLSSIQLFFQMVEAKGLVVGTWWQIGGMACAAAIVAVNGYIHAFAQGENKGEEWMAREIDVNEARQKLIREAARQLPARLPTLDQAQTEKVPVRAAQRATGVPPVSPMGSTKFGQSLLQQLSHDAEGQLKHS